jgi:tetraacyldisaccharide 4'-kinase
MIINLLHSFYKAVVDRRNASFDKKKNIKYKASCPVISIGNLSMGGSGKTPLVQLITRLLLEKGKKPVVIGRGYKKKKKGEVVVSDGKNILATPEEAGDEMYLLAKSLPVPIIANEKKYLAAAAAEIKFNPDCIIVDDGFQHRYLERDLDIVIIDEKTNNNPQLPPKGKMRELPESLKRANVIAKNGVFKYSERIKKEIKDQVEIELSTSLGEPYSILNSKIRESNIKERLLAFSGIGSPEKFEKILEVNGFKIVEHRAFGDHVNYSTEKINFLVSFAKKLNIKFMITTEKDSVKLLKYSNYFSDNNLELFVVPLKMEISSGLELLIKKIDSLFA